MKKVFFTIILTSICMIQSNAETTELQLIEQTVMHYFDGMVNHNSESIEKAFHPSATMKWNDDKFMEVNAIKALSDYVNSNDAAKTKTSIISITTVGDVANAHLKLEYETFYFVDFMQLMKIGG